MNDDTPFAFGAHESSHDDRTFAHPTIPKGRYAGVKYEVEDIENQHKVGICTAISLIQMAEKVYGRKFSPEFQYLMQKKLDGNMDEGSSIFTALKVAKSIGFLPAELFPLSEQDRFNPYYVYAAKLADISDDEIERLKGLCINKIPAYAKIDVSTFDSIAQAITDSEAGILCRYDVGGEWWTPSWLPKDINPLRAPKSPVSGHAIIGANISSIVVGSELANTWGTDWNNQGRGDAPFDTYKPTEAWIPYWNNVPKEIVRLLAPVFMRDLSFGSTGSDVEKLQRFLIGKGLLTTGIFGFYGPKTVAAVKDFQKQNNLPVTGYFGPMTRKIINLIY